MGGAGEPQEDTESSLPRGDDLRHCRQTVDIMTQLIAHLCFLLHVFITSPMVQLSRHLPTSLGVPDIIPSSYLGYSSRKGNYPNVYQDLVE
uniref:Uncharacterized protein n=1 Tax=Timema shepardi TaxID=629360 RepID=A0A7R9AL32_TIMSH|nr:unnamed protein product [Timema shepardi]